MTVRKRRLVIPAFVPFQGCRNRCTYCDQRALQGCGDDSGDLSRLVEIYRRSSRTEPDVVELAFYGGTFLGMPAARRATLIGQASALKDAGRITAARISTSPESVTTRSVEALRGVIDTVELGVQSFDGRILALLGRSGREPDVRRAAAILAGQGIDLGIQLMLGLPGETTATVLDAVVRTIRLRPSLVRLYPLMVFRRTVLEGQYRSGAFLPPSRDNVIARGAAALEMFRRAGITVARIGLDAFVQPADVAFRHDEQAWRCAMERHLWLHALSSDVQDRGGRGGRLVMNARDADGSGIASQLPVTIVRGSVPPGVAIWEDDGKEVRLDRLDIRSVASPGASFMI